MSKNQLEEKPQKSLLRRIFSKIFSLVLVAAILILAIRLAIVRSSNFQEFCGRDSANNCDAIVAISGGNTSARTAHAVEIFNQNYGKKLIFSGANSNPNIASDARQMSIQAQNSGIAKSEILLEENAKNTHENAKFVAEIIKQNKFKSVILVTSPYHQGRAELEFKKALDSTGVQVYSAPAQNDVDWNEFWWLKPRGWYLAASEVVGIFRFLIGVSNFNG